MSLVNQSELLVSLNITQAQPLKNYSRASILRPQLPHDPDFHTAKMPAITKYLTDILYKKERTLLTTFSYRMKRNQLTWAHTAVELPPPITTSTAILLLVSRSQNSSLKSSRTTHATSQLLYTLLYVVPFYLSPKTRPSATLSRDAPSVIRARITSVSLTCAVASLSTLAVLVVKGGYENSRAFHAMGYWPLGLGEAFRAVLLTALLFLGPLFESLVVEGYWREWMTGEPVKELLSDWITWRNLVAVSAPCL